MCAWIEKSEVRRSEDCRGRHPEKAMVK